jgi:tape measure domain-containing protein
MSTKIGDLAIYISANTAGLTRDLARGSASVASFAASAGRSLASLFRDGAGVAVGNLMADGVRTAASGTRELVRSSLDLAKAAEVSAMKFETILGSVEKTRDLMADLKGFAAASPLSLADASESAVRLLSAGVEREQVTPTLKVLTEVAGGSPQATKDAIRAYTQVKATGRLQGDEWNQFANLGTINYDDLAKVLKRDNGRAVDATEVKKMIEAGKVSFYDLQKAMKLATEEGGRFFGLSDKYAQTYAGRLDKLQDSWDEAKRGFGEALIQEVGLKGAVDDATRLVDKAKEFGKALGGVARVVKDITVPLVSGIADATSALYKFGQRAAAFAVGEGGTLRKGEESRAKFAADDHRARENMRVFGLAEADARNLGDLQDFAAKALADQRVGEKLAAEWRQKAEAHVAFPEVRAQDLAIAARYEKDAKEAFGFRETFAARIGDILNRGDPAKVAAATKGAFVPTKPMIEPRLTDLAGKLNEQFADPIKKFRDDMADLKKLRDAGKLDPNVYEAGLVDLRRGLEERAGAGGGPQPLAPAFEAGSQALANIVGRAASGQGPNDVPALLEKIRGLLASQDETAKQIAANTGQRPAVVNAPE